MGVVIQDITMHANTLTRQTTTKWNGSTTRCCLVQGSVGKNTVFIQPAWGHSVHLSRERKHKGQENQGKLNRVSRQQLDGWKSCPSLRAEKGGTCREDCRTGFWNRWRFPAICSIWTYQGCRVSTKCFRSSSCTHRRAWLHFRWRPSKV